MDNPPGGEDDGRARHLAAAQAVQASAQIVVDDDGVAHEDDRFACHGRKQSEFVNGGQVGREPGALDNNHLGFFGWPNQQN